MLRKGLLTKREKACLKYRWEFLRRNAKYIKDYLFILQKLHVFDLIRISYPESRSQRALEILAKWDLLNPIPPNLSFDDLVKSDRESGSFYLESLTTNVEAIDCYEDVDSLDNKSVYVKGGHLEVRVNMHLPKQKICDEFNLLVDRWQKRLQEVSRSLPNKEPESRILTKQYNHYLKVYDQHIKGAHIDELAKRFYKNYITSHGMHYARRRAKRDLGNCLRLINEGFKQIL